MAKLSFLFLLLFLSCKHPSKITPITTSQDYEKGELFIDKRNDSAFYYFNKIATTSKNRLLIAQSYNEMAIIQAGAGDDFGCQENLLTSIKYLDGKTDESKTCLSSDYNELGNSSLNLKKYEAAIAYYDKALGLITNDDYKIVLISNKALAYQKMQQYPISVSIYQSIINQTKNDRKTYARILSNMAYTKWLSDSNYHADRELLTALQIRKNEKSNWGLNASYAHLSDFYSHSQPDSGLIYAEKMYAVAKELNSPDNVLEALQKLIKLGPPAEVKNYFARYQYLNDSLQTSRSNAKNQFALIKYDAAKNKEDNLILQKDNAVKICASLNYLLAFLLLLFFLLLSYFGIENENKKHYANSN